MSASPLSGAFSRPFRGFDHRAALSNSVWLVFLIAAVTPTIANPANAWPHRVAILVHAAAFGALFWFIVGSADYYPRGWPERHRQVLTIFVLSASALSAIPLLHQWSIVYFPFVASHLAFGFSNRTGGILVAVTAEGVFAAAWAFDDRYLLSYFIVLVFWPAFVWLLSVFSRLEETTRHAREELQLVRERETIARDIHDLLGHTLTVMNLKAELASRLVAVDPDAARREIDHIASLSRTALAEARSTVTRMRSPDFAGEVEAAARGLSTAGISADLPDADSVGAVSGGNAQLFTWVLKEATTNILRHSAAARVVVQCSTHKLQIDDDGVGFPPSILLDPLALPSGLGGLARRVHDAGGALHLSTSELGGARILVTLTRDAVPMEVDRADR
ncbi:sensor histidine kinase [Corynebacterium uterequi]|uniref:Signal transduction histidine kinase n=1 Tax=Corynebacterium uterequi TaxID=1072256 RepID=A0A0G3HG82_9CORY|nr:histidine kinase [Corynebacterium uterequi]AKK10963.1 signal transduction histidine kinase [Corynebacterium uterequi]